MNGRPLLDPGTGAELLRAGAIIAYPTEAVYGLGCDPRNERAVRQLIKLKSRDPDAGFILIADCHARFEDFIQAVDAAQLRSALASWPGPVTWLFPRAAGVPDWLAGRHATIALRVTAHPVARELCARFGGAIVSTSANRSGEPEARSAADVERLFGARIAGTVAGELGGRERPSEIRDLASGAVIRQGG